MFGSEIVNGLMLKFGLDKASILLLSLSRHGLNCLFCSTTHITRLAEMPNHA